MSEKKHANQQKKQIKRPNPHMEQNLHPKRKITSATFMNENDNLALGRITNSKLNRRKTKINKR